MQAKGDGPERLAQHYRHRVSFFAHKVARRYLLGNRWEDELVSAGYWGLAKALGNRRPDATSRELSAYVSQRILGAVIARNCAQARQLAALVEAEPELELAAAVPLNIVCLRYRGRGGDAPAQSQQRNQASARPAGRVARRLRPRPAGQG